MTRILPTMPAQTARDLALEYNGLSVRERWFLAAQMQLVAIDARYAPLLAAPLVDGPTKMRSYSQHGRMPGR